MTIRVRFVSYLVVCVASVIILASVAQAQSPCPTPTSPDVTTQHNDDCRTGWQQNETVLTPGTVGAANAFGLLWQYTVSGVVFAQPLAFHSNGVIGSQNTCSNCDVVLIADEQNYVYAFEADPSSQQLLMVNLSRPGSAM